MELMVMAAVILGMMLGFFVFRTRQHEKGHTNGVASDASNEKVSKSYSKAEIASHNKRTDCWIIIKDKVYDVTSYVEEHPGGDAILDHAGDDSTEGFFGYTQRGRETNCAPGCVKDQYLDLLCSICSPQHATRVFDMIDDFYIGDLQK